MQLKDLCFILPADFQDVQSIDQDKVHKNTSKLSSTSHHLFRAQILDSIWRSLRRFLESKWMSCHWKVSLNKWSTIRFHDTVGVQLAHRAGVHNPRIFSYSELFVGSNGFSDDGVLGSGGFGKVYRAVLPSDGTVVAVKCLMEKGEHIEKTFAAELLAVANLRHRNLVRLRGWCAHDDQLLLVYDYMPNLSLDRVLFGRKADSILSWEHRKKIVNGLAAALFYLHEQLETQIIHRDVKASNVMLDSSFNARLGDFGLARWLEHELRFETTPSRKNRAFRLVETTTIGGTIGYLPPETFQKRGAANAKSDVFSFGIVALETASGRRAVDLAYPDDQIILLDWVRRLSDEQLLMHAADSRLPDGSYMLSDMERLIHVGLLCTVHDPQSRPNMKWVVDALSGNMLGKLPGIPSFQSEPPYISLSSSTSKTNSSIINTGSTFTANSSTMALTSPNFVSANGETLYLTAEDEIRNSSLSRGQRCQKAFRMIDTPREITYKEIVSATNNFSDSRRIAEVDFGTAYHGFLDDSHHVIIKRLGRINCPVLRMRFSNEFENMARLRHRNLVQLRGWCTEHGEMLVVYDYSPNRLLSHFLFHNNAGNRHCVLLWHQRYNIIKSLASAIYYLHEEWEDKVIHRNITSSAIILDPDMNPRLGSFALAEFLSRNEQDVRMTDKNTPVRGIFGYMAPEYMESGEATTMADVYSFGIVLLEIVTGKMAVDFRWPEGLLVKRVNDFEARKRPYEELADLRLGGEYDHKELIRVIKLGIMCTRSNPESRPSMKQIVNILDGHDKCFMDNGLKKEGRREWRQRNASSLSLVRRAQALGIH